MHVLEHLSFAAAGLLYWWFLLSPIPSRLRLDGMGPVAYMFSTKILVGLLGVVLAFSPELLYDAYGTGGTRWGLSPLDDQHVAGLIMALEQSIVMGIALAWLFARMLAESEAEDQRAERYADPPEAARHSSRDGLAKRAEPTPSDPGAPAGSASRPFGASPAGPGAGSASRPGGTSTAARGSGASGAAAGVGFLDRRRSGRDRLQERPDAGRAAAGR